MWSFLSRHLYIGILHGSPYLIAVLLVYLAQVVWFLKAWRMLSSIGRPLLRISLRCFLAAAGIVLITAGIDLPSRHLFPHQGLADWVASISRVWMLASFVGLLAVVVVRSGAKLAICALPAASRDGPGTSRRSFLRQCVFLAGGAPFCGIAYGYGSRLKYQIEKKELPVANLPEGLDGLHIVQLSDIHIGDFTQRDDVRRAVEMANQLRPDLIVVTGDFISWQGDPLEDCISELGRLNAPLGIWGCNGNHEMYVRAEHLSQELFYRYGMRLLRQQRAELEWRGEKINLIGVDFQKQRGPSGEEMPMLGGIEPLIRRDIPNILLSHNPNSFYRAARLGIELSLAGHTHGGQICMGDKDLSPARLYTEFVAGTYRIPLGGDVPDNKPGRSSSATLYVNRGLGTFWIPVRLGAPPEISFLSLRRAV
jgi:predicted MPP superfamily phosphohydrolase